MRCKKHLTDLSSSVGVCASCLRERLFILVAVQAQAQEDRRKSDAHLPPPPQPPPLHLPRSVSPPRIPRQNSERNHHRRHRQSLKDQLFFSTPQVGPTRAYDYDNHNPPVKEKIESAARFSLLSRLLFRSKAKKKGMESDLYSVNSSGASTSSGSWFLNMLSGHRKKQPTAEFGRSRDRGMSPARVSDYGEEAEDWFEGAGGYSSASSRSWWQTPRRAGSRRGGAGGGRLSQSRTGMAFCLSPLVRASPGRSWNGKGVTADTAFSGEIRFPVNLSTAAAFCANRSRKLADFGRSNHNH